MDYYVEQCCVKRIEQTCLSVTDTRALICVESAVIAELTDICSVIWAKAIDFSAFSLE
ncbi:hypothetical protein [Paenibacillus sp. NRS-1760]|uniref:hypothetical protein n=1 Tax=Paenibacillus sp. NRS-1760 TaxID=3233902 RepID=UPI003D2B3064